MTTAVNCSNEMNCQFRQESLWPLWIYHISSCCMNLMLPSSRRTQELRFLFQGRKYSLEVCKPQDSFSESEKKEVALLVAKWINQLVRNFEILFYRIFSSQEKALSPLWEKFGWIIGEVRMVDLLPAMLEGLLAQCGGDNGIFHTFGFGASFTVE